VSIHSLHLKFMFSAALIEVYSAERSLIGVDVLVTIVIDLTALSGRFLRSSAINPSWILSDARNAFSRGPWPKLRIFLLIVDLR